MLCLCECVCVCMQVCVCMCVCGRVTSASELDKFSRYDDISKVISK